MTTTTPRPLNGRVPNLARRAFCFLAIAACAPYLLLKGAWLTGSRVGIPEDSTLLEGNEAALHAVNALTVVMDAVVIVLALALIQPWGRRLPAWLLLGPLWIGTGLLTPILIGAPLIGVLSTVGSSGGGAGPEAEPFLDGWVSTVVYGGFSVQALALGTLFFLYVKDRWGAALRGRLADLRKDGRKGDLAGMGERPPQALTLLALACSMVPFTLHLLWALGARTGLPGHLAEEMDGALRISEAVHAGFALAALVAVVLVAYRPWRRVRVLTLAVLSWCGGSVMTAWSGWWLLMSATNALGADQPSEQEVFGPYVLTYAAQMIAGLLVLTLSVLFARQHLAGRLAAQPSIDDQNDLEDRDGQDGQAPAERALVARP